MKKFLEDWGVTLCGAITSVLTALAVLLFQKLTGFNFFTFSVWLVVPVGAIGTGFLAASGYMLGSLYFHHKPTKMMLLNMAVIAAGTQILIYFLEYSTLVLDDGRTASDLVSFGAYLDVALTKAKYSVGHNHRNGFEVGGFGYVLALIQFVGFILGGVLVYFNLAAKPMCEKCKKYYRSLASRIQNFESTDAFKPYGEKLLSVPRFSDEYLACLREEHKGKKTAQGSVKVTFGLHGCPECKGQFVSEEIEVFNGKDWKSISDLSRKTLVPEQQSLLDEFKKKQAA